VFLYTIGGQLSNIVWCLNGTLACSIHCFLIIYCVSGVGNVISVVVPAAACLLILGFLGASIITQWTQ
jgi:hypothetical protein